MAQAAIGNSETGQTLREYDDTFDVNLSVGEIFLQTRQKYKLSHEEIAHIIRIKPEHLHAMEQNKYDRLPGPVYTLGFVRSYADYLGLPPQKMVNLFKAQNGAAKPAPSNLNSLPDTKDETSLPSKWILIACIMILPILWVIASQSHKVAYEDVPEPPQTIGAETTEQVVSTIGIGAKKLSETPFGPSVAANNIAMRIVKDSWVEIINGKGEKVVSRVLKAGEGYLLPNDPDMVLSVGNAAGVKLSIGDRAFNVLGRTGTVKRNISLNPRALIENIGFAENGQAPVLQTLD